MWPGPHPSCFSSHSFFSLARHGPHAALMVLHSAFSLGLFISSITPHVSAMTENGSRPPHLARATPTMRAKLCARMQLQLQALTSTIAEVRAASGMITSDMKQSSRSSATRSASCVRNGGRQRRSGFVPLSHVSLSWLEKPTGSQ